MDKHCDEWKLQPLVNPLTKRKIKIDGPTYKKLLKSCSDKPSSSTKPIKSEGVCIVKPSIDSPRVAVNVLTKRYFDAEFITSVIQTIPLKQWDRCVSKFNDVLTDVKLLGSGTFGRVYSASLSGATFVIKEAYLTKVEENRLRKNITAYPDEFKMLEMTRHLLDTNVVPNFLYAYNLSVCEKCQVFNQKVGACYLAFMELADQDLLHLSKCKTTANEQWSIFCQLMLAVSALHRQYGLLHRDIKKENVLIKRIPKGGWYEYNVGTETFYVENAGHLVLLADFGASLVLKPKYGLGKWFGSRNAKLVNGNLVPITIRGNVQRRWIGPNDETLYGTFNLVTMKTTAVDPNDTITYPATEFFTDIQDSIRMFIGGKRVDQPGYHEKLAYLDDEINRKLSACFSLRFIPRTNNAMYLVASIMLRFLIPNQSKPKNIIAMFRQS